MVEHFLREIYTVILQMFSWTDQIFTKFDGWTFVFAAFTIVTIFRFVLYPLLGGKTVTAGSDFVKTVHNYYDDSSSKSSKSGGRSGGRKYG